MVLTVLARVLHLALCLFPHMESYLSAAMLLLRPGNGVKIALLVYYACCMITSEAVNIIHNIHSVLFACPGLGCYIWVLFNNRTQPLGERVESGFFQPFRPDTAVFENIDLSLGVKDGLIFLLVLLCLLSVACSLYTTLSHRAVLRVLRRRLEEEERTEPAGTTSAQPAPEGRGTQSTATGTTSAQPAPEGKGAKSRETGTTSAQPAPEGKGTQSRETGTTSAQPAPEGRGTQRAVSASTQTVTEPGQPEPAAAAPVQKKKSKSKSMHTVTDEELAGPSHPAEEPEPGVITLSVSPDLWRELAPQSNESILAWLLRLWDARASDTPVDRSEARQLGSLCWDVVYAQGTRRTQEPLSLWW
ncbi:uncharacterized protein LOC128784080 [Vidua chalybeata]|uniref:uncharacterized protein LOC128784080 n=1 Tax=Vidua chalybeata TaxID=81927 RepID=UPI0023A8C83C|nr:uncharacterized protein LOC128784080 [Vidua chalybeata]